MTARRRTALVVAAVAFAAAGVAAAAVLSAGGGSESSASATTPKLRPGRPPLSFALGFRTDPEARDLAQGAALYGRGDTAAAASVFARHDSLEAKVGAAFAEWPNGSLDRLEQLAKLYPDSAVVQLHLGLARLWANEGDPVEAWRAVLDEAPDTPYALVAGNLLHPELPARPARVHPVLLGAASVTRLPPRRQLAALRAAAGGAECARASSTASGSSAWEGPCRRRASSTRRRRQFPNDVEARVASAVGHFDKDSPADAFGRLGPLTRTYPNEPTVRFHLGVLLLWTGRVDEAKRQFRLASRLQPGSPLAREADRYLETIRKARG